MHSIKRYTARQCNQRLGLQGPFWQQESYDHWVRDFDELDRIIRYIEENPVKAGLAETPEVWPFSSARARKLTKAEWGLPLPKGASGLES